MQNTTFLVRKFIYLILMICCFSLMLPGCKSTKKGTAVRIIKPVNRKRYYKPNKDRWKRRTKTVKVRNK